jgi:hypothetical protein
MWDELVANGAKGEFQRAHDVFHTKFHGLF